MRSVVAMSSNLVLIVEDDPDLQGALQHLLASEGYAIALAGNGAEAIEFLEQNPLPRAVLVDLLMPGIVGHELLDYLRDHEALRSIPVAIISGSPELAPEGYPVFAKPLDVQELLAFMRSNAPRPRS
jgi:CheY-like chemotaxis protein